MSATSGPPRRSSRTSGDLPRLTSVPPAVTRRSANPASEAPGRLSADSTQRSVGIPSGSPKNPSAPPAATRRSSGSRSGSAPKRTSVPSSVRRSVILDRDGTLIDFVRDEELGSVVTAFHPSQLRLLPGVVEGLRLLAAHRFVLAIATNQPGAAKGQISSAAIAHTNDALVAMLRAQGVAIAATATCPHHPEGGPGGDASLIGLCECRKPKPGLVRSLLRELSLDPRASFMVGDTMHDVEAGAAAGTRTGLLVDLGRCELCPLKEASSGGGARGEARPKPAGARPDLVAPRFDLLARAIVDAFA